MLKSYACFLFLCFLMQWNVVICTAQTLDKYSRVKIYTDGEGLKKLAEKGVAFDHGEVKKGIYFSSDFSDREVKIIKESGFKYEILIEDVSAYYARQNSAESLAKEEEQGRTVNCKNDYIKSPSHFHLGSYAGFFTYDELLSILDSMQLLYPNLISKRVPIDSTKTWESRPVYWLRISNKPNVEQKNKPQIFYNALHHAREPVSVSQIVYFMWYLLDNYHTDMEVKSIVDNMELYFVPCINPDGYVYNIKNNPTGGGMHRKNKRKNSGGSIGVDINRNYDNHWGYDNQGSSADQSADSYRGPGAASEPETKMIKKFCIDHKFTMALSCHAYGEYLIHSWGYNGTVPPVDSKLFANYGAFMAKENGYKVGTPSQTVGYTGNGASSDWFYGEVTTKNKIYEYSPEAGSSGFYPSKSSIIPICKDMLYTNIKAAKIVLKDVYAIDKEPYYITTKNGYFNYQYKSLVPDSMASFSISILPLSSNILNVGAAKNYSNTTINTTIKDSISFTLNAAVTNGSVLKYVIQLKNKVFTHNDTVTKVYGQPTVVFSDDGNSLNQWVANSPWGISTAVYHSPTSSIADSPSGNYANNTSATVTTKNGLDLTKSKNALLRFWAKWNIEQSFDYVQLQASLDGQNWSPLCGKYTSTGTANQDKGNPIYDAKQDWVEEEVNLDAYCGNTIWLRFIIKTDGQNAADGFYFDDFLVEKLDDNSIGIPSYDLSPFISSCHPNPATEYVYVNYIIKNGLSNSRLTVFNAIGQPVYSEPITSSSGNLKINTSDWEAGIYYYNIQAGNEFSKSFKLCIIH